MKILFGPAGLGTPASEGLERCKKLGLEAAEVEFTYGVRMTNSAAKQIGESAKKLNIKLSVHAPYYINLSSKEKAKIAASKLRILQSCERAHYLGASPVVFHAGFYQGQSEEETFQKINQAIIDIQKTIKTKGWDVKLAPETTGKKSQFSGLEDLLRLKKETGCEICVDFAHLKARNNGIIDYDNIMKQLKHLSHIHAHFSGIEFTEKGERRHQLVKEKDAKELLYYLKKYNISATIINESPDTFGDAVKMKRLL